jgi:hypothetical protein
VQDPGGPILLVTVQGFPEVVNALKANGGIIGTGEKSETLAADARATWARDPNGGLESASHILPGIDMPGITRTIIIELQARIAAGMSPMLPVPVYRDHRGTWRRDGKHLFASGAR